MKTARMQKDVESVLTNVGPVYAPLYVEMSILSVMMKSLLVSYPQLVSSSWVFYVSFSEDIQSVISRTF